MLKRLTCFFLLAVAFLAAGCDDGVAPVPTDTPFIEGTAADAQIGVVVNSTGNAVRFFQLADPDEVREVPLGASASVTPTGVAIREWKLAMPLGNAASVAIIDATDQRIERFFLFPSGNATGAAFTENGALLVANLSEDEVGRIALNQESDAIEHRVPVAPAPTHIEVAAGRAFVVSSNLDDSFAPLGPGVVTALDPVSLEVEGTVETGGTNATSAAVGPDGLLYVVNTGNYRDPGNLAVIDPATLERVEVVENIGVGPGSIIIDKDGLAYISGFFFGTLVFDTGSRRFVRGPGDPVCARLPEGGCRGAFSTAVAEDGRVYQAFFGSTSQGLAPWIFVYEAGTYALSDSIPSGQGPTAIRVTTFTR